LGPLSRPRAFLEKGIGVTAPLSAYRSSNFAPAFLLLSSGRQRALQAVYAFCREVDDSVDNAASGSSPRSLDLWRRLLRDPSDILAAEELGSAAWPPLSAALDEFAIDPRHLLDLVDGVSRDLRQNRYRTFEELKEYCYGVASTVGLACLPIFGLSEEEHREFAVNLGIAVQLTNILRDVASDADRGRVYLPQEDLKRFGYAEEDLFARRYNESFVRLMRFQVSRAREHYASAVCALPPTSRRAARPALVMSRVYHALLAEIERRDYDVFRGRATLSPWRKLRCVLETLF
jgi:15-cis-phytoene synthase